jgi:hypothetical protein
VGLQNNFVEKEEIFGFVSYPGATDCNFGKAAAPAKNNGSVFFCRHETVFFPRKYFSLQILEDRISMNLF